MKKFFNKHFWTLLIVLSALGLAGSAAYFSISGLSKLFGGSALQVIIMASFFEFAKISVTAALHRHWKSMKSLGSSILKYLLILMVVIVMGITSSGIYGFLADAYSKTSIELDKMKGQIELVEKKQEQKKSVIDGINETKEMKSNRIKSLIDIRGQQEIRLDSLRNKGWRSSMKSAENSITASNEEIVKLGIEIDTLIAQSNRVSAEIGLMDIEKLDLQHSDVATEIGPLKYMSTVLDKPMDSVINWFILALIFVFDPLAVLLIIFASSIYDTNDVDSNPKKDIDALEDYRADIEDEEYEDEEGDEEIIEELEDEPIEELDDDEEIIEVQEEELVEVQEEIISENNYQRKIVNAINNVESIEDIVDFSYDIPEEKEDEVVEYVENENGDFKKNEEPIESIATLIKGIDSNPIYLQLLDILFLDGERVVGDTIPPYKMLIQNIVDKGIICSDKEVKNFLTICNLLDITNMSDKDNVKITKNYSISKGIISLVSK